MSFQRTVVAGFLMGCSFAASLLALQPVRAALPVDPGEAVATCFSGLVNVNNPAQGLMATPVVGIVDVSDPKFEPAMPGQHWLASMFHNDLVEQPVPADTSQVWNAANLGQVFGITFDDASPPNIYVAATTSYGLFKDGTAYKANMFRSGSSGGPGAVYRLDGATGQITTLARLPNSGPALGDVAYDRVHRQFFVSNFDDGMIYRLAGAGHVSGLPAGTVLGQPYDHGVVNLGLPADSGEQMCLSFSSAVQSATCRSGFAPRGRRPWAVQVFGGRLFYSIWVNDVRVFNDVTRDAAPNEIWSVPLDPATGDFVTTPAAAKLEIFLTRPLTKYTDINNNPVLYSNPVSDIAFSAAGRMLVAERTMNDDVGPDAVSGFDGHRARVLEFQGGSQNWSPGNVFNVGAASAGLVGGVRANAEGGVDYGYDVFDYSFGTPATSRECDQTVWATGEQILGPSFPFVYGLQGIRASGNTDDITATPSFAVDLNGLVTSNDVLDKARIGDVEIARHSCFETCLRLAEVQATCVADRSGDVLVTFQLTNLTSGTIYHLFISDLPAGVTTPDDHVFFPGGVVGNGGTATAGPIRFHNAPPGPLSFTISIHDAELVECCATRVTIEIPSCDCGQIVDQNSCILLPQTHFIYNFTFTSLFQQSSVPHVFVIPVSPGNVTFDPNVFPASPPLQYGQSLTGTATIDGSGAVPGQRVCLRISAHDAAFRECCAIDRCFTLSRFCEFGPFDDFDITINWRDSAGRTGSGTAVRLSDDSAYFWFFDPQNVELVVKVLDGRAINGHWWFFYGALSDVEYTITLTDTNTGASKTYFNPAGRFASVGDTEALPGSTSALGAAPRAASSPAIEALIADGTAGCAAGPTALCLRRGRFKVEVVWRDPSGRTGAGQAIPLSSETGFFWFFGDENVELAVKILDGRPVNGHWWVFYGSLSDVQYTITVTDTTTGAVRTYFNPAGTLASVGDTAAF